MTSELLSAAERVVAALRVRSAGRDRPLLVAMDGGSGSGKSVLASLAAARLDAVVVPGDDFFAAGITDAGWGMRTPAERARDAIDWRRLRAEALEPLLAGERVVWHPFDFARGVLPDGTYAMSERPEIREPAPVIILEGAYTARPELVSLIDLSVFVDVPVRVRHRRLAAREDPDFLAGWHQRWDVAEAWYFAQARPASSFDLVVRNG